MSDQVLARKWRPQTFADVVGQGPVLTALTNSLALRRIHHAYLLSGTRGVGKTTIARLLAKGLNCKASITAVPCGQCANCHDIGQGCFADLIEIDAASRTKVEDTRDLLDNVQYAPVRGRFKVYLIDEIHMLSRHSFNALLKTLEEPPSHVKFILVTTEPHKLPITILSRCLQFHLKALDVQEIRNQLKRILQKEKVPNDDIALQLLAYTANGSMRDALSLTDQAIVLGQGQITDASVKEMLGTIDNNQPLTIIEALVDANGQRLMTQIAQSASQGVDWENLLVATLTLLHHIAMMQLLPTMFNNQYASLECRIRKLARNVPPSDVQLYYQTLIIGRKELSYAPDRRMGIEMTLLRALAFHPKVPITNQKNIPSQVIQPITTRQSQDTSSSLNQTDIVQNEKQLNLSNATTKLLKARTQLQQQEISTKKKNKTSTLKVTLQKNVTQKQLNTINKQLQKYYTEKIISGEQANPEAHYLHSLSSLETASTIPTTPKTTYTTVGYEGNSALSIKIIIESIERDVWAGEIAKLKLPKLVEQLALNTFKRQFQEGNICLHLRSIQCHLNSPSSQKILADALSELYSHLVKLTVVLDDNLAERTPLEWRQIIYEEKLMFARQSIITDTHIQKLCRLFNTELDKDNIWPI
ncbi:DNA polymerase III, g and t subunits [Serratia symbiotica str. 'Cinara cedri']|nr:DNA polymerase III, g and t subunits [Serratia symbiotica str. 'Cinara cedri']